MRGTRPVFSWTGGEPGATFTWQVLSEGTVISQGDTLDPRVALGPLAPGSYAFQVRQTGASGRAGPFSVADPFTVERAVSSVRAVPHTSNARLLRPMAGATTTHARPLLSWHRRPGASLYNLQIFRVHNGTLTKIISSFPHGTRTRVRGLRFGERYAWRVWPYLRGSGYTRGAPGHELLRHVAPPAAHARSDAGEPPHRPGGPAAGRAPSSGGSTRGSWPATCATRGSARRRSTRPSPPRPGGRRGHRGGGRAAPGHRGRRPRPGLRAAASR